MRLVRPLIVLALASGIAACGGASGTGLAPTCQGCTTYELAAELDPPEGSTALATEQLTHLRLLSDATLPALSFERPVLFQGRVLWGAEATTSIAAEIVLTAPSRIAGGTPLSYYTQATSGATTGMAAFSILVPPLPVPETYAITVTPLDPGWAARTPPTTLAEPMTGSHYHDLVVGGSASVIELTGALLDATGAPVAGALVSVDLPPADPLDFGGAPLSTIAATGSDGSFLLAYPRGPALDVVVHVASPAAASTILPDVFYERHLDVSLVCGTSAPLGEFRLPAFTPPATYRLAVEGPGQSGASIPAGGALVTFEFAVEGTSTSPWIGWRYRVSGTVAPDGSLALPLLPGTTDVPRPYHVTIAPPADSPLASFDESLSVGPPAASGAELLVSLMARPYLVGTLDDASGAPARNVVVTALRSDPGTSGSTWGGPFSGVTQASGQFAVPVDPNFGLSPSGTTLAAIYDLDLQPPEGASLPAWSFDNQGIDPSLYTAANDMPLGTLALPPGVAVTGLVLDADGNPVPDVGVKLFAVSSPLPGCTGSAAACTPPPRQRASARSGADGSFMVVLANPS